MSDCVFLSFPVGMSREGMLFSCILRLQNIIDSSLPNDCNRTIATMTPAAPDYNACSTPAAGNKEKGTRILFFRRTEQET
jgi:hypothetical protein